MLPREPRSLHQCGRPGEDLLEDAELHERPVLAEDEMDGVETGRDPSLAAVARGVAAQDSPASARRLDGGAPQEAVGWADPA